MAPDTVENRRQLVASPARRHPPFFVQFWRYAAVGVLNAALYFIFINALSVLFGIYSGVRLAAVNIPAAVIVIIHSYFLNKFWAFKSFAPLLSSEFLKFLAVNAGAVAINFGVVYAMTTHLRPAFGLSPLFWENVSNLVALAGIVVWNFLGFRFFVFRGKPPEA